MQAEQAVRIVPANEASAHDLDAIFGARGEGAYCRCQRYKLQPKESFDAVPVEVRAERQRMQARCGDLSSPTTSGLVAFIDGEQVGWCAVEPRSHYPGLLRVYRIPWMGRAEDKSDATVWAVTCLFTRAGYRRRGVSRALAQGAVAHARARGARALEAYPMVTQPGQDVPWGELQVGTEGVFAEAGLAVVNHPTPRRLVMRIEFGSAGA